MVLWTKNFNIFGVHWKIRLFGGILKNQYIGGDCLKRGGDWTVCWFKGSWQERRGWCSWGEGGIWYPNAHYDYFAHLELSRIDLPKLNSSILMAIVTIPVGQVDEFYFYMLFKGFAFWKNYLWTSLSLSYSLKVTCILLRLVIPLKKMVVLSVKFTILISWSPICIPLIFLSALMRLASTSAVLLYNNLDSW